MKKTKLDQSIQFFFKKIYVSCQGAGISQAGRHETEILGELAICELPRITFTNLSARGLVKLSFGDVVTDVLWSRVVNRGLLNV